MGDLLAGIRQGVRRAVVTGGVRRPVATRAVVGAVATGAVLLTVTAPASPALPAHPGVEWDTYGFSADREGRNPYESALGPGNVHLLRQTWSVGLGGVIDTQPLVASQVSVRVPHTNQVTTKDLVIAGTEKGLLAAVNASNGRRLWQAHLGYVDVPACTDLPHYGITGTPVIDRSTNSVYAADGVGRVDRLDLSTGRVEHRWVLTTDPQHEHVYGALTLLAGVVYVELAGNCDIPPYHGRVIAIDPRRGTIRRWFVTGRQGPDGGGIWGWAGISADAGSGALYAATGNSVGGTFRNAGYAERVVALTPRLRVSASNYPGLPAGDADFGATPVLYRAGGCPAQLAVGNKYGSFFVYDRRRIPRGPVQRLSLGGAPPNNHVLIGVGAYWPAHRLLYVTNASRRGGYGPGILAFRVTRRCRLTLAWQAPGRAHHASSPTLANGVLFYDSGLSGAVRAVNALTGKRLWWHSLGAPAFNAPSVANGALYVGAWDRRLHAFGLR